MLKIANLPLNEITVKSQFNDGDYFFIIKDGQPYRVSVNNITASGDWDELENKPFDEIDTHKLTVDVKQDSDNKSVRYLTLNDSYLNEIIENTVNEKIKGMSLTGKNTAVKINLKAMQTSYYCVNSSDIKVIG